MSGHQSPATAEAEGVAERLGEFTFSDNGGANQHHKTLKDAMSSFEKAAEALSEHGKKIIDLLADDDVFIKEDVHTIYSAHTKASQLRTRAQSVSESMSQSVVQAVVKYVTSSGDARDHHVGELLKYLENHIESIASRVISKSNDADTLWKVAEECYHQAARPDGELSPDVYLNSLGGSNGKLLLDHHELAREEMLEDEKRKAREDWIRFWTRSSNKCPGGPTIFQPLDTFLRLPVERPPKTTPRYLFRAFDSESKGLNNLDVMASWLSQCDDSNLHKKDLLSMDRQQASEMLHGHLRGLGSNKMDNLMSWSSSLIFVIQYANWRSCRQWNGKEDQILICAVDTTKFPQGQFARDMWLLGHYSGMRYNEDARTLRNWRLNRGYDNGEYLSQGILSHKGRSCVCSLREMKLAGLSRLYPEFCIDGVPPDTLVRTQWTNYVSLLRKSWTNQKRTTRDEVDWAMQIARECFKGFEEEDITLLLLAFREREVKSCRGIPFEEPKEVDRYLNLRIQLSPLKETSEQKGTELLAQLYNLDDAEERIDCGT